MRDSPARVRATQPVESDLDRRFHIAALLIVKSRGEDSTHRYQRTNTHWYRNPGPRLATSRLAPHVARPRGRSNAQQTNSACARVYAKVRL